MVSLTLDDVVGYERQRHVSHAWFGAELIPAVGEVYYSAIVVPAEKGETIFAEQEILFEGRRYEIIGQTVHVDAGLIHRQPWRFQLYPARGGEEG